MRMVQDTAWPAIHTIWGDVFMARAAKPLKAGEEATVPSCTCRSEEKQCERVCSFETLLCVKARLKDLKVSGCFKCHSRMEGAAGDLCNLPVINAFGDAARKLHQHPRRLLVQAPGSVWCISEVEMTQGDLDNQKRKLSCIFLCYLVCLHLFHPVSIGAVG